MKIVKIFQLKIVILTAVKNRCMLHGRVIVMRTAIRFNMHFNKALIERNRPCERKLVNEIPSDLMIQCTLLSSLLFILFVKVNDVFLNRLIF